MNPFPEIEQNPMLKLVKTEIDDKFGVRFDVAEVDLGRLKGGSVQALNILGTHLCGYVTFPKLPLKEPGYDHLCDVDVHGGVTYAQQNEDGSYTYGFDCAHFGDSDRSNCKRPNWILSEARNLYQEIVKFQKQEHKTSIWKRVLSLFSKGN